MAGDDFPYSPDGRYDADDAARAKRRRREAASAAKPLRDDSYQAVRKRKRKRNLGYAFYDPELETLTLWL